MGLGAGEEAVREPENLSFQTLVCKQNALWKPWQHNDSTIFQRRKTKDKINNTEPVDIHYRTGIWLDIMKRNFLIGSI